LAARRSREVVECPDALGAADNIDAVEALIDGASLPWLPELMAAASDPSRP
jgi:hypothetical protein